MSECLVALIQQRGINIIIDHLSLLRVLIHAFLFALLLLHRLIILIFPGSQERLAFTFVRALHLVPASHLNKVIDGVT